MVTKSVKIALRNLEPVENKGFLALPGRKPEQDFSVLKRRFEQADFFHPWSCFLNLPFSPVFSRFLSFSPFFFFSYFLYLPSFVRNLIQKIKKTKLKKPSNHQQLQTTTTQIIIFLNFKN